MKTSVQLKALIRNLSEKLRVKAEILLRNFMMERFLVRLSASEYKHNFILKQNCHRPWHPTTLTLRQICRRIGEQAFAESAGRVRYLEKCHGSCELDE